jgi:apolipoprotein N-acyltransferase
VNEIPRRRIETLSVAAAGVVGTVLAYPPAWVPGLGLVMLAPIAWLLDGARPRRAFLLAWLYSAAFAIWSCRFVVHALVVEYQVAALPSWLFLVLVVLGVALIPGGAGAAYAVLRPRGGAAAALVFAAVWTLGEWLRGSVAGVPWLLASQSVSRWPLALQVADLGGSYAVSFALIAVGGGLGIAVRRRDARVLAAPALVALLWLGYGALRLAMFAEPAGPRARVGVVQASVPQSERFGPDTAERNLARHETATRALVAKGPLDLVVWSETAVDIDVDRHPRIRARLERLAAEVGVPIVTGAPRSARGRLTNAALVVTPERGLAESYDKQRLVPFSEYDPFFAEWLAPLIGPVLEGPPYVAGREATVFRAGPIPFATPICFEITYADLVRGFRAEGAQLLVNLSNDAWFGRIGYPELHFAHAVLRAVETRSSVVRGANTGISGVVDARGRVLDELPAFAEGTLRVDVAAAGALPPYARTGDAPLLVLLVAGLVVSVLRERGGRRS